MTTELPSINSTTSISDNVALKNYYENLLFRNASGKSLSDLNNNNHNNINHNINHNNEHFIHEDSLTLNFGNNTPFSAHHQIHSTPTTQHSYDNNHFSKNHYHNNHNNFMTFNNPPSSAPNFPVYHNQNYSNNHMIHSNNHHQHYTNNTMSSNNNSHGLNHGNNNHGITHNNINNNLNINSTSNDFIIDSNQSIKPNDKLRDIYNKFGKNYFSSEIVFSLIDNLKLNLLNEKIISKFLNYLLEINNLNSIELYAPLCLVSLKNGKLELLSNKQITTTTENKSNNNLLLLERGDLVIIDGDRGKDLGMVIEGKVNIELAIFINFLKKKIHFDSLITNPSNHIDNSNFIETLLSDTNNIIDNNGINYDKFELIKLIIPSKNIIRFASNLEIINFLPKKFNDELLALNYINNKLKFKKNLNLNFKIISSEFQFDYKKLTFYYICNKRNDFRDLIKDLFKFYKTRIWLCAIPNNLDVENLYCKEEEEDVKDIEQDIKNYKFDNFQIGIYIELIKQLFNISLV